MPNKPIRGELVVRTERSVRGELRAKPDQRDTYRDMIVSGLRLRVTDSGHKGYAKKVEDKLARTRCD